jgi:excinuclease ABC subunit C
MLPKGPGVYWFLNHTGDVLYVGKAKNLRSRVQSYQLQQPLFPKTKKLVGLIKNTRFQVTQNELQALLLEAELIRLHQPPYNIRLKDDKSPLYIGITKDIYPRVLRLRKTQIASFSLQSIFGPYDSSQKVTRVLKLLRRMFPYCTKKPAQKPSSPCFYVHVGLCPGACAHQITPLVYARNIHHLTLFLKRKNSRLIKSIQTSIEALSRHEAYEKAAAQKATLNALLHVVSSGALKADLTLPNLTLDTNANQLKSLIHLLKQHLPIPTDYSLARIEGYDISNLQSRHTTASMVVFHNGTADKSHYRHFKFPLVTQPNDVAMIKAVLTRRLKHTDWPRPELILIDGGIGQLKAARKVIPWNIPVVAITKHPDRLMILDPYSKVHQIRLLAVIPATQLITQIRDESHRFSRRLMHHLLKQTYQS